jgi:hypothetical protein
LWFDLFLSIPAAQSIGFPTMILMQMAHCVIVLYRLSTFDDAGWYRALARETLDFSVVLDALAQRMTEAATGMHDDGSEEDNVWGSTEKRVGAIKSWWDAKVLAEEGRTGRVRSEEVGVGEVGMEFWDDSWLDILGLRDYQF